MREPWVMHINLQLTDMILVVQKCNIGYFRQVEFNCNISFVILRLLFENNNWLNNICCWVPYHVPHSETIWRLSDLQARLGQDGLANGEIPWNGKPLTHCQCTTLSMYYFRMTATIISTTKRKDTLIPNMPLAISNIVDN